ncbi:MAG: hypothetical protein IT195_12405 [Microthrixaceae bacterium]|nr:hypothetical protein [Microthrixaceae bacterium]
MTTSSDPTETATIGPGQPTDPDLAVAVHEALRARKALRRIVQICAEAGRPPATRLWDIRQTAADALTDGAPHALWLELGLRPAPEANPQRSEGAAAP